MYAKRTLRPNHAKLGDGTTAGKVTVTAYRYKKSTRKWVKVKSALRSLTTTSAYQWSSRPRARGTYRLVTTFAGDAEKRRSSAVSSASLPAKSGPECDRSAKLAS
jgi:hypothetical protein